MLKLTRWKDEYQFYVNRTLVGGVDIHDYRDRISLWSLVIKSIHRRKGYGTKMLRDIKKMTKKLKKRFIELHVERENVAAINLYTKFGFKKLDKYPKDYSFKMILKV